MLRGCALLVCAEGAAFKCVCVGVCMCVCVWSRRVVFGRAAGAGGRLLSACVGSDLVASGGGGCCGDGGEWGMKRAPFRTLAFPEGRKGTGAAGERKRRVESWRSFLTRNHTWPRRPDDNNNSHPLWSAALTRRDRTALALPPRSLALLFASRKMSCGLPIVKK